MLKLVVIMLSGIAVGFLFRKRNLQFLPRLTTFAVWGLLFLLGISVGSNREILDSLHSLGMYALVLSLGGIFGSAALAWVVYRYFFSNK